MEFYLNVKHNLQFELPHHKDQLLVEVAASIYRCPIKKPNKFYMSVFLDIFTTKNNCVE